MRTVMHECEEKVEKNQGGGARTKNFSVFRIQNTRLEWLLGEKIKMKGKKKMEKGKERKLHKMMYKMP